MVEPIKILMLILLLTVPAMADETANREQNETPGYEDANNDGVNDLFRDADGDGVNDITGKTYPHRFPFIDRDGDGNNDWFVDANGDGINDIARVNRRGDVSFHSVLDYDADGLNDITREPTGNIGRRRMFIDRDGDGINDYYPIGRGKGFNVAVSADSTVDGNVATGNAWNVRPNRMSGRRGVDRFIDRDGDGINDGRGFSRGRRRKGRNCRQR